MGGPLSPSLMEMIDHACVLAQAETGAIVGWNSLFEQLSPTLPQKGASLDALKFDPGFAEMYKKQAALLRDGQSPDSLPWVPLNDESNAVNRRDARIVHFDEKNDTVLLCIRVRTGWDILSRPASKKEYFDSFPVMVALHDLDGTYLAINEPYCIFLNRPRASILGHNLEEILEKNSIRLMRENIAHCLSVGKISSVNLDFQIFGQSKQVEFSLQPILDNAGTPQAVLIVGSDVHEHRNMEKRIVHLTGLLHTASQVAQILFSDEGTFDDTVNAVLGLLGEATNANRVYVWNIHESPCPDPNPELHATRLYEWSQGADIQQDSVIYTNRPISKLIPTWIDTFQSGKCVNNLVRNVPVIEQELLASQGIISIMTAPITFHGELWGFIGFGNCHSEYIWTEEEENILRAAGTLVGTAIRNRRMNIALRESQDRFRRIEEATGKILWKLNKKHRFEYISDGVTPVLGYTRDELMGTKLRALMANPTDFDWYSLTPENPFVRSVELRCRTRDGDTRWLRTSCQVLFDDAGGVSAIFGTSLDVTEIHQARQALESANARLATAARVATQFADEARKANFAKSDFLANMSHEIRTPMNAILGLINLVLRTELHPKQFEYLEKIDFSARSLLRIINDILDFSKVEAGKMEMEKAPFFVESIIRGVQDMVRHKLDDKDIAIILNVDTSVKGQYIGDSLRLNQVLTNLMANAVKFTTQGSITATVKTVETTDLSAKLLFSIADTGIGMTEEERAKLFMPFTQADTSTTRQYGGTGLGLALCKKLVHLMGGTIWCESKVNKGSIFSFTAQFGRFEEHANNVAVPASFKDIRTIIVENDPTIREELYTMLHTLGCRKINRAASGTSVRSVLYNPSFALEYDLLITGQEPNSSDLEGAIRSRGTGKPVLGIIIADYAGTGNISNVNTDGIIRTTFSQIGLYQAIIQTCGQEIPLGGQIEEQRAERDMMRAFAGSRILLVEDNDINQMVAQELLTQAGMLVDIARNGLNSLEMLEKNDYDLILMDIQMPIMDGLTATRRIRASKKYADLPIIAMTAHALNDDEGKSLEAGMNAHITKPIDSKQLFHCLTEWLCKNRKTQEE